MRIDRRRLLRAAGAIVTAASVCTPALTRSKLPPAMTLVDPTLTEHDLHAAGIAPDPRQEAWMIQPDFVRQWRDGLGKEIALAGGATAYVRWDKALLLTDFARESGMRARQRRLSRAVFAISIR